MEREREQGGRLIEMSHRDGVHAQRVDEDSLEAELGGTDALWERHLSANLPEGITDARVVIDDPADACSVSPKAQHIK
jgi:hypothetical protein